MAVAKIRPFPVYRRDLCVACGACAAACRTGALVISTAPTGAGIIWRFLPEVCMGCGRCARYCPTGAITFMPGTERPPSPPKAVTRATFSLRRCSSCGVPYAAAPQIEHLATLVPDGFLGLCVACRRHRAALSLDLVSLAGLPHASVTGPAGRGK